MNRFLIRWGQAAAVCSAVLLLCHGQNAFGELKILTTTTTLGSVVEKLVGDKGEVFCVARGPQDPHYIEAKPSYMLKARRSDLLVLVGLELEVGWLPNVIRGSRNPKILPGSYGYLETGKFIEAIEVPKGKVDRSEGDIHPAGNPHYYLDPQKMAEAAAAISERLGLLDRDNAAVFKANKERWVNGLNLKIKEWEKRIKRSKVTQVITYHRTLNYFLKRFNIALAGEIESKPGIPPTAKHIIKLMNLIKRERTPCILQESFFEAGAANRIQKETSIKVISIPTEVEAMPGVGNYEQLIDRLVSSLETCGETSKGK